MPSLRASVLSLLTVTLAASGVACSGADAAPAPDDEQDLKGVSTAALVRGNTELATDLYGQLAAGDDNVFFSPYSISSALAMTFAGARKGTATAMKGALNLPAGNVHAAFRALGADLAKREKADRGPGRDGDGFQLAVANALWGEKTQHFESAFLNLVKTNYGGGLESADFKGKPDAERGRINDWVEEHTNDKIKDLLPPGILKSDTKLVLVNAIHFKASWEKAFQKEATRKDKFATLAGAKVDADMMARRGKMKYAGDATFDAVALPYLGGEVELFAIAPKPGKFKTFERDLDRATMDSIYAKLDTQEVALRFPKFKIAGASVKLKDALTKLGMGVAFTDDADLTGITGKNDTKISDVVHKAFIDLDEKGTEAAAATAVIVIGKTSIRPGQVIDASFDRPFVFAIRDVPTGSILFLGRVANPKE